MCMFRPVVTLILFGSGFVGFVVQYNMGICDLSKFVSIMVEVIDNIHAGVLVAL